MTPAAMHVCVVLAAAAVNFEASASDLQFQGFSAARFEAGTVIRMPQHRPVKDLVVRVPDRAGAFRNSLRISMCDMSTWKFSTIASRVDKAEIIQATANERGGFFTEEQACRIRLTATRRDLNFAAQEWTVLPWAHAYLQAKTARSDILSPSVRLNEPAEGRFTAQNVRTVTVKGAVVDQGDFRKVEEAGGFRISVNGLEVERDFTRGGWAFTGEVRLDADSREVEILVTSPLGSATRLLVPVVR